MQIKKIVQVFLKFYYIHTFHQMMEGAGFFLSKLFYYNTYRQLKCAGVVYDCVTLCFVIHAFYFLNYLFVRF
jgi:hypothetical protein